MKFNADIPLHRVYIAKSNFGLTESGFFEAYWYGVTSIAGRSIGAHVTLENGANWTRVPIHWLTHKPVVYGKPEYIQPWDCFGYQIEVNRFPFLRDQDVKLLDKDVKGIYSFTIDWADPEGTSPFAEYPEQHKQMHVILGQDGLIYLRPNNMLQFRDKALYTLDKDLPRFKAITEIYRGESEE